MPNIRQLTSEIAVAPQIRTTHMAVIVEQGFQTVINNRPDGEAPDQPTNATLQEAAKRQGLHWRFIPAVSGALTEQNVRDVEAALAAAEGPVLLFCRTGTRSTILWALTQVGKRSEDEIVTIAARAGYDLSALRPQLKQTAQ